MKIEPVVNMQLTQPEWESLMAIAMVAYGSEELDLQDMAFAEMILIRGGVEMDDEEEETDATKH